MSLIRDPNMVKLIDQSTAPENLAQSSLGMWQVLETYARGCVSQDEATQFMADIASREKSICQGVIIKSSIIIKMSLSFKAALESQDLKNDVQELLKYMQGKDVKQLATQYFNIFNKKLVDIKSNIKLLKQANENLKKHKMNLSPYAGIIGLKNEMDILEAELKTASKSTLSDVDKFERKDMAWSGMFEAHESQYKVCNQAVDIYNQFIVSGVTPQQVLTAIKNCDDTIKQALVDLKEPMQLHAQAVATREKVLAAKKNFGLTKSPTGPVTAPPDVKASMGMVKVN